MDDSDDSDTERNGDALYHRSIDSARRDNSDASDVIIIEDEDSTENDAKSSWINSDRKFSFHFMIRYS